MGPWMWFMKCSAKAVSYEFCDIEKDWLLLTSCVLHETIMCWCLLGYWILSVDLIDGTLRSRRESRMPGYGNGMPRRIVPQKPLECNQNAVVSGSQNLHGQLRIPAYIAADWIAHRILPNRSIPPYVTGEHTGHMTWSWDYDTHASVKLCLHVYIMLFFIIVDLRLSYLELLIDSE